MSRSRVLLTRDNVSVPEKEEVPEDERTDEGQGGVKTRCEGVRPICSEVSSVPGPKPRLFVQLPRQLQ